MELRPWGWGMLGFVSASLMGCIGWAPPMPTELEARLLALFRCVLLCIALWVGCLLYTIMWCCQGKSCRRRKGAPPFTRASPGTVW